MGRFKFEANLPSLFGKKTIANFNLDEKFFEFSSLRDCSFWSDISFMRSRCCCQKSSLSPLSAILSSPQLFFLVATHFCRFNNENDVPRFRLHWYRLLCGVLKAETWNTLSCTIAEVSRTRKIEVYIWPKFFRSFFSPSLTLLKIQLENFSWQATPMSKDCNNTMMNRSIWEKDSHWLL